MDKLQLLNDHPLPFAKVLGLKFVAASDTAVKAEMVVKPELCTRPDARKLTWRCETPDCRAKASWLAPRRRCQVRSMGPNMSGCGGRAAGAAARDVRIMKQKIAPDRRSADYLGRNCWKDCPMRPLARRF